MKETSHEVEDREEVLSNAKSNQTQKEEQLAKLELAFYRRRLVNANYFRDVKNLLTVKEVENTAQVEEIKEND